jgi:hypothetical protein
MTITSGASTAGRQKLGQIGGDSGGDMGTMDWLGIGMQVAGAMANQSEEEKKRKLEEEKYKKSLQLSGQARQDQLLQQTVENQRATRTQNQNGLNYMTGLVDLNRQAGTKRNYPSFRQSLIGGI